MSVLAADARSHPLKRRQLRVAERLALRWAAPAFKAAESMSGDVDAAVRLVAATSETCPSEALRRLAGDDEGEVRAAVAANPSTPPGALARLAADMELDVRAAAAANPSTPAPTLEAVAASDHWKSLQSLAKNPSASPRALRLVAEAWVTYGSENLAHNPSTPADLLEDLIGGRCPHRVKCPDDECRWQEESRLEVAAGVAANPSTPLSVISDMEECWRTDHEFAMALARVETDTQRLEEWAEHSDEWVRGEAAANPNTSPETLALLSADRSDHVGERVAAHPACPPAALRSFAHDGAHLAQVVSNANCPDDVLAFIALEDGDAWMAAEHPNCPPDTLRDMASKGVEVAAVAANPNCPADTAAAIEISHGTYLRSALAQRAMRLLGG